MPSRPPKTETRQYNLNARPSRLRPNVSARTRAGCKCAVHDVQEFLFVASRVHCSPCQSVFCSENIFHVCGFWVSTPDVSFWAVQPSSFFTNQVNTKGTAWFRCLLVLDVALEQQEWTLMRSTRETTGVSKDHEMKNRQRFSMKSVGGSRTNRPGS